ncbi:MAG TPA: dynamin family protein [Vicinamibacteria bacterium]|nr:dynamin family protein [Vicinamibacteria bacterium]
MSLARILSDKEEKLLREERSALGELRLALERVGIEEGDASSFDASHRQLDELFLLVVAGEFNSGKSAFINALLGEALLEEGVTPTTRRITVVTQGEKTSRENGLVTAPIDVLENVNIVDTPGTNAIEREHERITREFLPRADLVLFVTSADRPFTESERAFLESIRNWGKKIVLVVNKIDVLEDSRQIDEVEGFVSAQGAKLLGGSPEVFPVSARLALRAKQAKNDELLTASRFAALEAHIARTLDERERVRLKLLNPLGVAGALVEKYLGVVSAELGLLKDDLEMLSEIERQLTLYREDQTRDFGYRLADIDNALLDFEKRGAHFFEETLRLTRVFEIVNKARVKADFEKKVVADLPQTVEKRTEAVIDWMVESELRQWKAVMTHLEKRRTAREGRLVGRLPTTFEQDRKRLLDSVGAAARRAVEGYDRERESTRLADSVQAAVASTALLEVGAVGLGTLVSLIATSTAVDVTGILAAGALSIVGLLVLPAKRRRARRELNAKVAEVREQLMGSLRQQFEREMTASLSRIEDAVAPYTRFVRSERDRLGKARTELEDSRSELGGLKEEIDGL